MQGSIKVHVDGFYRARCNWSGIGGIFRNYEGNILIQFSKHIHIESAIHAELLAVCEGLLTVTTYCWATSSTFVFEFNFQTIVAWFSNHSGALWRFQNTIREYLFNFSRYIWWSISHIRRSNNAVADILARIALQERCFLTTTKFDVKSLKTC